MAQLEYSDWLQTVKISDTSISLSLLVGVGWTAKGRLFEHTVPLAKTQRLKVRKLIKASSQARLTRAPLVVASRIHNTINSRSCRMVKRPRCLARRMLVVFFQVSTMQQPPPMLFPYAAVPFLINALLRSDF